jgi:pilus assembly protein CpaB
MSGKWPIVAVLGLGLLASVCAAVLMAALKAGGASANAAPKTVEILVVNADLPGMTKIEQELLETKEVGVREKPDGAFTDPVQVLGRVLKAGLVAGQPVLASTLLEDDGGAQLASSLPSGMRAVSVEINGSSALRGLLFPGSRVDVIVAYKSVPGSRGTGPVSRTLLQNVGVLAVEDKTVFTVESDDEDDKSKGSSLSRRSTRGLMVTLMVDPQQARELQSARDVGQLSLSLRNPLDASLTADPAAAEQEDTNPTVVVESEPVEAAGPWRVVVVRGDKTEVLTFGGETPPAEAEAGGDRFADAPTEFDEEIE